MRRFLWGRRRAGTTELLPIFFLGWGLDPRLVELAAAEPECYRLVTPGDL